ncbi:hypothetical protein GCM10025864_44610 [Luteimicrobium album]|uniref:DUF2746 domain-containing protein n=1 Tax=Luteimicrobium album TaxID=1054550 RepID=A0ABQ6HV09_9MICO|nr:hypothetical protein [Luteimicrobium album]GMA22296.1 hypothetical protein GCM10025864_00550 [Luteimicrobium album]GMA26702.1 hypothetical protein GCM10025864_44610 [Luteimicrobium album]
MHLVVTLWAEFADDTAAPAPTGHDWLIATIGSVVITAIVAPVLARLLNRRTHRELRHHGEVLAEIREQQSRAEQTSETIRAQVQNDHDRNLRDDVDHLTDAVERVAKAAAQNAGAQRRTARTLSRVEAAVTEVAERLDEHLTRD